MAPTASRKGKISRLYADGDGLSLRLKSVKGNYNYTLRLSHPNYNSLFALAMAAAAQQWNITVRLTAQVEDGKNGDISYLVVDF